MAKRSFKQRAKRNALRDRSKTLRKYVRSTPRRHNRRDESKRLSTATSEEIFSAIWKGDAVATVDRCDARSLADAMLAAKRSSGPLPLPPPEGVARTQGDHGDAYKRLIRNDGADESENKNKYKRRGMPYLFWERCGLCSSLVDSLRRLKFSHPTPVQEETLPTLLQSPQKSPIAVVAAETGSGKTLVFALPILNDIMSRLGKGGTSEKKRNREEMESIGPAPAEHEIRVMHSLILSPTRELALQITSMIKSLIPEGSGIRIGCIVGGMAPTKQQRILNGAPHILVATPGRLWALLRPNEGCYLGYSLSRRLVFLVLDEADKLLAEGGRRFEEIALLLERIRSDTLPLGELQPPSKDHDTNAEDHVEERDEEEEGEEEYAEGEEQLEAGEWDPVTKTFRAAAPSALLPQRPVAARDRPRQTAAPPAPPAGHRVATVVTSATLTLETQYTKRDGKGGTVLKTGSAGTLSTVMARLSLPPPPPSMRFDQSAASSPAVAVTETYLRCPSGGKDVALVDFLKRHGERCVVFVGSISMVRRLINILPLLNLPCSAVHASMQQRQRLKHVDRFRRGDTKVMIATDVACRGLDIDGVRYVVHYQIPRSTDAYIHRCGRTARCGGTGLSLCLVAPDEFKAFGELQKSLGRSANAMEIYATQPHLMRTVRQQLMVAKQIDDLLRSVKKTSANSRWVEEMADRAEVDADDMIDTDALSSRQEKLKAAKVLQKRLSAMMARDAGNLGGRGAFRSSASVLGSAAAGKRWLDRAKRQSHGH